MTFLSAELNRIAKLLEQSRSQVVIVVGTGVSINATGQPQASWLGLLKHGIRHLVQHRFQPQWGVELETSLDRAFAPFQLHAALQHAELVEQALKTPNEQAFARWLEVAFADLKCRELPEARASLKALSDLQHAGALLLTTNYDNLLTDQTALPPITWEETEDFHRVMTRQKPGILHIHGHWRRPSSIVLGRSSYQRVVSDQRLQELLRTLWLNWTWVYVGCGAGLDDPNLGRLLEWAKAWGQSALPDFFLAPEAEAVAVAVRAKNPANLVSIGYPGFADLPAVLQTICPASRCRPFVRVDQDFSLFRVPGSSIPFPSRQEYLAGDVPTLAADLELRDRLQNHGWACVIDVASVGKTTLALRAATTPEQRGHPVFYLDLKDEIVDEEDASPVAALHRLARPAALLILDNAHHRPDLARRLWQQWNARPADSRSRLLIIATRAHQLAVTPEHDLSFFESHPLNPSLAVQLTPQDLARVARHIHQRVAGAGARALPEPPAAVLAHWHRDYRASLNAFTFAVMKSLADFERGSWELPLERAAEWVQEKWLAKLDEQERANAICLAAFAAQEIEMLVSSEALPHPGRLACLVRLGLLARTEFGRLGQYVGLGFREPEWGRLLLAALETPVDLEKVRFAAAACHPVMALTLSDRLKQATYRKERLRLWAAIAAGRTQLGANLFTIQLPWIEGLFREALVSNQPELVSFLWETVEHQPEKLAAAAWATSLENVGSFWNLARANQRDMTRWWQLLESHPDKLIAAAWATPLEKLGSFLDVAEKHGRSTTTTTLWRALGNDPERVVAAAWTTALEKVGSFFEVAQRHRCDTTRWWEVIEDQFDNLLAIARTTPLEHLGSFLAIAKAQKRDTTRWWEALENEIDPIISAAWSTTLAGIGSFLEVAKSFGRDPSRWWEAVERHPDRLIAAVWASSLENVGSFLDVAKAHGRDTASLWQTIEHDRDKLAAQMWSSSLRGTAFFVETARRHGRDPQPLWQLLALDAERFARRAAEADLDDLVGFAHYAPTPLVALALRQIQPGHWESSPLTQSIGQSTWLAWNCAKAGRDDLASDLIQLLLRRANPQDFPLQAGGFGQVCWLLAHVPASSDGVDGFLSRVCTPKWLRTAYSRVALGQLAAGLRQLALHQTVGCCRHFHNNVLGGRLNAELARFETATPIEQSQTIQLLGSAGLCGWAIGSGLLARLLPITVARLPVAVLPHSPEVPRLQDHQLQLWLGLRSFVSVTRQPLSLPAPIIEETWRRWQVNATDSAVAPSTVLHRLNQSMVRWLETCWRSTPAQLLPCREPLWVLTGFPAQFVPSSTSDRSKAQGLA